MSPETARLLADAVLVAHVLVATFNALSLPLVWLGAWLGWAFVRNPWFRFLHVGLMGFVLLETLLGWMCPLTSWESQLRAAAGQGGGPGGGFIAHWFGRLLFFDCAAWKFVAVYGVFYALVLLSLWWVPVRRAR
ncbi:DUF2784 domain-containing protein [Salidesulfovibrio onnuriiensis]|uniref:DUF2784 domain-containing protein n=1 Tax=Salidesulfovibrio onnuriiensis TaxID=2583823 RepID=UPI001C9C41F5|nr:DUF2784 domain-containing protein [Salidesulfovibrio onnuriiensis]